jgi:aspartate kinase
MKIVVLKFGGTSVGSTKKIKRVAEIIGDYKRKNYSVIVVSSAMSGVTNDLVKKSKEIFLIKNTMYLFHLESKWLVL